MVTKAWMFSSGDLQAPNRILAALQFWINYSDFVKIQADPRNTFVWDCLLLELVKALSGAARHVAFFTQSLMNYTHDRSPLHALGREESANLNCWDSLSHFLLVFNQSINNHTLSSNLTETSDMVTMTSSNVKSQQGFYQLLIKLGKFLILWAA